MKRTFRKLFALLIAAAIAATTAVIPTGAAGEDGENQQLAANDNFYEEATEFLSADAGQDYFSEIIVETEPKEALTVEGWTADSAYFIKDGQPIDPMPEIVKALGIQDKIPGFDKADALKNEEEGVMSAQSAPTMSGLGYTVTKSGTRYIITKPYQTKTLLVRLESGKTTLADSFGAIDSVNDGTGYYLLRYATEAATKAAERKLNASADVKYAEPNMVVRSLYDDTATHHPFTDWGVATMHTDEYIEDVLIPNGKTAATNEVIVAVADTGMDIGVFDAVFPGRRYMIAGEDEYFSLYEEMPATVDIQGHGTHVAGTIADITPDNVKIFPVKALADDGYGTTAAIIASIEWAAENGANLINMSLGGRGTSDIYKNAIQGILNEYGTIVIAASGNDSADAANYAPAGFNNVITVGATNIDDGIADFSNYGEPLDVSAPGVRIMSLEADDEFGGDNTPAFVAMNGTSMACPHATGAAALLMMNHGTNLSLAQLTNLFKGTVKDAGETGWDAAFGWGIVDFAATGLLDVPSVPVSGVTIVNYGSSTAIDSMRALFSQALITGYTQLSAIISPANATNKTVTFSSSDTDVATITNDGKLTFEGAGTTTITVTTNNNKTDSFVLTLDSAEDFWSEHAADSFAGGGNGSSSSPFKIGTPEELALLVNIVNQDSGMTTVYVEQTADLNMSTYEWIPPSATGYYEQIYYNGNGYTIDGLNMTVDPIKGDDVNSFASFMGAGTGEVYNLNLTNVDIEGLEEVGGVYGRSRGAWIYNVYVSGTIAGNDMVGGLVGQNLDGSPTYPAYIYDSYCTATIKPYNGDSPDNAYIGGLIGLDVNTCNFDNLPNTYFAGDLSAFDNEIQFVGGIIGVYFGMDTTHTYSEYDVLTDAFTTHSNTISGESDPNQNLLKGYLYYNVDPAAPMWDEDYTSDGGQWSYGWDFDDVWQLPDDYTTPTSDGGNYNLPVFIAASDVPGDFDGNRVIDERDLYILEKFVLSGAEYDADYDINADGENVNQADIDAFAAYLAYINLGAPWPIANDYSTILGYQPGIDPELLIGNSEEPDSADFEVGETYSTGLANAFGVEADVEEQTVHVPIYVRAPAIEEVNGYEETVPMILSFETYLSGYANFVGVDQDGDDSSYSVASQISANDKYIFTTFYIDYEEIQSYAGTEDLIYLGDFLVEVPAGTGTYYMYPYIKTSFGYLAAEQWLVPFTGVISVKEASPAAPSDGTFYYDYDDELIYSTYNEDMQIQMQDDEWVDFHGTIGASVTEILDGNGVTAIRYAETATDYASLGYAVEGLVRDTIYIEGIDEDGDFGFDYGTTLSFYSDGSGSAAIASGIETGEYNISELEDYAGDTVYYSFAADTDEFRTALVEYSVLPAPELAVANVIDGSFNVTYTVDGVEFQYSSDGNAEWSDLMTDTTDGTIPFTGLGETYTYNIRAREYGTATTEGGLWSDTLTVSDDISPFDPTNVSVTNGDGVAITTGDTVPYGSTVTANVGEDNGTSTVTWTFNGATYVGDSLVLSDGAVNAAFGLNLAPAALIGKTVRVVITSDDTTVVGSYTVTFTIGQTASSAVAPTISEVYTYGQTLADVDLTAFPGWSWDDPTEELIVAVDGYGYDATYVDPLGISEGAESAIIVKTNKATPTLSNVRATAINFGSMLSASSVTGVAMGAFLETLTGTWAFNTPSVAPQLSGSQFVTFTPTGEDAANYNTAQVQVYVEVYPLPTVNINPAAISVSDGTIVPITVTITDPITNAGITGLTLTGTIVGQEPINFTDTSTGIYSASFEATGATATVFNGVVAITGLPANYSTPANPTFRITITDKAAYELSLSASSGPYSVGQNVSLYADTDAPDGSTIVFYRDGVLLETMTVADGQASMIVRLNANLNNFTAVYNAETNGTTAGYVNTTATLTVNATPRAATITTPDYVITVGDPYPTITYSVDPAAAEAAMLVTPEFDFASGANNNAVGVYNIVVETQAVAVEYAYSYDVGTLTVIRDVAGTTAIAPILREKDINSITLVKLTGYEYNIDDGPWQSSNVFTGLSANTSYKFGQRIAQTDVSEASQPAYSVFTTFPVYTPPYYPPMGGGGSGGGGGGGGSGGGGDTDDGSDNGGGGTDDGGNDNGGTEDDRPPYSSENVNPSGSVNSAETLAIINESEDDNVTVKTKNATSISKNTIQKIVETGKDVDLWFDTLSDDGKKTVARLYVDADSAAEWGKDLYVEVNIAPLGYDTDDDLNDVQTKWDKYLGGETVVVSLTQKGKLPAGTKIAVLLDLGDLDVDNLFFYAYDRSKGTFRRLTDTEYYIDRNGYLHLNLSYGGDIIISDVQK
jgi:subtilisin family serine protease/uncharacterized membrane protein YgcG